MNSEKLFSYLFEITEGELKYIEHPGIMSTRYDKLKKVNIGDQEAFLFRFDTLLKTSNIFLHKESRFTPIPYHIHTNIEINYVYQGSCTQIINNKKFILHQGDVCILDTNTPHEILALGKDDILITIGMRKQYFSNGFLTRLSAQGLLSSFLANALTEHTDHKQYLIFYSHEDKQLRQVIEQLFCEYSDRQLCSNEIIDAYMIVFFSMLLRIYQKHQYEHSDISSKETQLYKILQYLEQNYKEVTLSICAQQFGFHPNYMGNYLKSKTGKTFKELVQLQRMSQASFFLLNSDLPVYEIAREVGYENLGFFYRKFRDQFHVNPREYRNS